MSEMRSSSERPVGSRGENNEAWPRPDQTRSLPTSLRERMFQMTRRPLLVVLASLASAWSFAAQPLTITTVAGHQPGPDDGIGSSARFNVPTGITTDSEG